MCDTFVALGPATKDGISLFAKNSDRPPREVMTGLIEAHGQGGSGHVHMEWPYHSGFLIADPTSAWILETSGRQWAARPVGDMGHVTNGLALGTDWVRGSADVTSHAVER